jgi:hypothetical protein
MDMSGLLMRGPLVAFTPLMNFLFNCIKWLPSVASQVKLLGSECQTSGTYAKRAKQATKKDKAAACLCFLNYLAFLRPAADRAVSILRSVVSPGRSYGFLWAGSIIQKMLGRTIPPRIIRQ